MTVFHRIRHTSASWRKQINFVEGSAPAMSVTYTATLTTREETVLYLAGLLHGERLRRGTRAGTRALGCFTQAVLIIRWFLDGTRVAQLAIDNAISRSTTYDYLYEGIDVLAAHTPGLESALLAAKMAGYSRRQHRRDDHRDRPLPYPRTHPRGGPVVVGQVRQPRRQHPGHHRPARLALVDLTGTPRP
jgi:hypothetical protein